MAELKRVARPGASVIVAATVHPTGRTKERLYAASEVREAGAPEVHTTTWNRDELIDTMEKSTLRVVGRDEILARPPLIKLYLCGPRPLTITKQWQKALGLSDRPLGPPSQGWITSTDLYRAVLDKEPYQVRGLVGFGVNLLLSHADAKRGAEALRSLEFHVQTDLYLTPTAAYADIASGWEREGLRVGFALDQRACEYIQLRPAIVPPRGEARADIDVVFDLAVRLGLGDHFWNGDVEAALAHHLAPSGLTPAMLRNAPRGAMRVPLETRYRKYREQGFVRPSGKLEIFSPTLQAIGQSPFPEFRAPHLDPISQFPLVLTCEDSDLLPQPASQSQSSTARGP
jgi:anaerobic selenocysteine-containing dehydrogenase